MARNNEHLLTNPFVAMLIKRVAKRIANKPYFSRSEEEDIAQDLSMKMLLSAPAYDPAEGGIESFAKTVIKRHGATLIRDARAEKRSRCGTVSLSAQVKVGHESIELAHTITLRDLDKRRLRDSRSEQELVELRLDVADISETLSAERRDMVEHLKHDSVVQFASKRGTPPSTARSRVKKLRRRFNGCR